MVKHFVLDGAKVRAKKIANEQKFDCDDYCNNCYKYAIVLCFRLEQFHQF